MSLPTVSAIVAAYNYGAFLERTVASAIAQDYPSELLEIVIVDDGSTDDTPEVAERLVAQHGAEKIRYIRQPNAGYVAATNRGFAEARGEVWAMLDADDLWAPDKTSLQVACLADPNVGMVYSDLEVIDADDCLLQESFFEWTNLPAHRGDRGLGVLTSWGNLATGSSVMVRASLGEVIAPIPANMPYVDWWLAARAADVGAVDYVAKPLVGYRMHGGNLTLLAQGDAGVRERLKAAKGRRCILSHVDLTELQPHELIGAWAGAERDAAGAMQMAGSAYIPIDRPTDADVAHARAAAARATRLDLRGRFDDALAAHVRAAAFDPFDGTRRARILEHGKVLPEAGSAAKDLADARSAVVLADAQAIVADPTELRAYAQAFTADDDVTLALVARDWDATTTETRLWATLTDLGLADDPACPDLLAIPSPTATHADLRAAADADLADGITQVRDAVRAALQVARRRPNTGE